MYSKPSQRLDYFFQIRRKKNNWEEQKGSFCSQLEWNHAVCLQPQGCATTAPPGCVCGGVTASSRRGPGCGRRGDDSGRALPAPPLLAARRPQARGAARAAARSCRDAVDFKSPADAVCDSHTTTRGDHSLPAMLSRISNLLKTWRNV